MTSVPNDRCYTVDDVLTFLDERATWIDREIKNGGSIPYLSPRYAECKYVADCIRDTRKRLMASHGPQCPCRDCDDQRARMPV